MVTNTLYSTLVFRKKCNVMVIVRIIDQNCVSAFYLLSESAYVVRLL